MDGYRPPRRRLIDWKRIKAGIERMVADLNRRPGDALADVAAAGLVTQVDEALVAYARREVEGHHFARAARKSDHVEDLRGVAGQLLDVLADWETLADRDK